MKIVLDLSKSINNYNWLFKDNLKEHINETLDLLDELLLELKEQDKLHIEDTTLNRFYDILDMFSSYEIIDKR